MDSLTHNEWQPQLRLDDVGKLFAWFRAQFGAAWVQDENDLKVWQAGLGGLSAERLRHGCETVQKSGDQHPPSLPAFLRMCKGSPAPYHYPPALPAPRTNVVLPKMARDRVKEMDAGKPMYKGYYIDPAYIPSEAGRKKYQAELDAWAASV